MPKNNEIKSWLERTGLAQRELAAILGVNESTISRVVNGTRRLGWDKAKRLARRMGVPMERLFQ